MLLAQPVPHQGEFSDVPHYYSCLNMHCLPVQSDQIKLYIIEANCSSCINSANLNWGQCVRVLSTFQ